MQQRIAIGRQLVSEGSTVRQAATKAGVGLSTLYKHLADKSDVRLGHRLGRRPALSDLEERRLIDFADGRMWRTSDQKDIQRPGMLSGGIISNI